MAEQGFVPVDVRDPFIWSTDLSREAWLSGGAALTWYIMVKCPLDMPVRMIVHSHGLQPTLWAAAMGVKIDVLISIGSPAREDMRDVATLARPNIRRWLHVRSAEWDPYEWLGEIGDGGFIFDRNKPPSVDLLETLPRVGHSKILFDPSWFPTWQDRGWLDRLREWR